jgi:hypothetical protein
VVEGGRIIERGTHVLYALGGRYLDLYTKQHGLQENLFLTHGECGSGQDEISKSLTENGDSAPNGNGAPEAKSSIVA